MTRALHCLPGALLCFLIAGCANYHLGQKGQVSFTTLYIEPVANRTMLPQAQAAVATQIREAFLKDGRVTIVSSPENADAVLHVQLTSYEREIASVRSDDTGLARKLALILRAECRLTDRRTGKVLFDRRPVATTKEAYTDSGQLQAEYQTLPLLAESLASHIAHTVLDVW